MHPCVQRFEARMYFREHILIRSADYFEQEHNRCLVRVHMHSASLFGYSKMPGWVRVSGHSHHLYENCCEVCQQHYREIVPHYVKQMKGARCFRINLFRGGKHYEHSWSHSYVGMVSNRVPDGKPVEYG